MRNQVGVRLPHRSSPAVSFNITRTNLSEVLTIVKGLELVEEDEALLQEIHAQTAKGIWWLQGEANNQTTVTNYFINRSSICDVRCSVLRG